MSYLAPARLSSRLRLLVAFTGFFAAAAGCSDKAAAPGSTTTPATTPPSPTPEQPAPAAVKQPPPISGGTLLVLAEGGTAIASDPDRDRVYVVDLRARQLRHTINLEVGAEPGRIVEDNEGRVHVALRGAGAILSLDPVTGAIQARREVCAAPRGLAFDGGAKLLHVACAGGELISIGALAQQPTRTLRIDHDLRDVVVRGNELLVTTFRKAEVLVVGGSGMAGRLTPSRAVPAFFGGNRDVPFPPGVSPSGGDNMASPAVAWRMVPTSNGGAVLLHQRGVDSPVGTQPNAYGNGQTCAGIVESVASRIVTAPGGGRTVQSGPALGGAVLAVDLALSPDGRTMAVVAAGHAGTDQQLLFYSMETATEPAPGGPPCVPGSPAPMPTDPGTGSDGGADAGAEADGGDPVIEYRPPNGELIAVAFDNVGNIIVQSRQPATLQILTQRTAPIVLASEVRADSGHQLFHGATTGKLACASCHPEGGEDGRVWTFVGLGARRTQSLRGGIMDTGPFHWNGDMSSFEHLMHDVFQGRMGGRKVERERMDSLSQWLDQIKSVAPSKMLEVAAVERGKALFHSPAVACVTCHNGKDYTSNATVDVGTGGAFQVPQLHNLALRAPYLHDGCATTLRDRFTKCGGGDRHGMTSKLSSTEIDDLVAYLESL
jgi:cytochrome c553